MTPKEARDYVVQRSNRCPSCTQPFMLSTDGGDHEAVDIARRFKALVKGGRIVIESAEDCEEALRTGAGVARP